MTKNIPFEIARDIAYFELHKKLTALSEKDPSGSPASKMQAMAYLREYENRTKQIHQQGLAENELKDILEDFKSNPISLQSSMNVEKQQYLISEMEHLLRDDYDCNNFVIRLIQAYGYSEAEAEAFQKESIEEIQNSGKLVLSVFDFANERCKELQTSK